jgi:hypothetical protein
LVRQEQYQDLLQAAERERLIRAAGLQPPSLWHLAGTMVARLQLKVAAWYPKPQRAVHAVGMSGDHCC